MITIMIPNATFSLVGVSSFLRMHAGHVTKAGDIAGPSVLEYIVDDVLYLKVEYKMESVVNDNVMNDDNIINSDGDSYEEDVEAKSEKILLMEIQ
ncbi:hypothetical protein V6N13_097839 [Hibiscus sabdariffa]